MSNMIFLGAGASAADGAPMQGSVFRDFARQMQTSEHPDRGATVWSASKAVPSFLRDFFGIEIYRDDLQHAQFPTFEEALGVLELARIRGEGFGALSHQLGRRPNNWPTVEQMRFILVEMLAGVVGNARKEALPPVHTLLCQDLKSNGLLDSVAFSTTNYDDFLESALVSVVGPGHLDYGFGGDPFSPLPAQPTGPTVLKVHGSLDWLYCPSCLSVARRGRGGTLQCASCQGFRESLIVPPTFFKELDNVILTAVWNSFRRSLRRTTHLVFCGYSFPDADLHIKYAFKHREVLERRAPLRVTVINEHDGKPDAARREEKERYSRFFCADVNYTPLSFEAFARDPGAVLGAPASTTA